MFVPPAEVFLRGWESWVDICSCAKPLLVALADNVLNRVGQFLGPPAGLIFRPYLSHMWHDLVGEQCGVLHS